MGGIVQSFLESWALIKLYICSVVKFKICHYKACVVGVCSCVWWSTTEIQLYTSPLTLRFPLKSLWSGLFPNNWSHILHLPGLVFRTSRFSFVACSLTPASPAPLPAPQSRLSSVTIIFLSPWGDQGEVKTLAEIRWAFQCASKPRTVRSNMRQSDGKPETGVSQGRRQPLLTSNPRLQERFPREARALDFSIKSFHFRNCSSSEPWRSVSSKLTNSPWR